MNNTLIEEVAGLYRVTPLRILRRTPGVFFDVVPVEGFEHLGAIDRVLHQQGAISPGPVGEVERPWYMHPHQMDNLVVLHGKRFIELYTRAHGAIVNFAMTASRLEKNGNLLEDGPVMLSWPCNVFHRIKSDDIEGSASINFAIHEPGWDIKTNFNIYDLDLRTGQYRLIREGYKDQPPADTAPQ